MLNVTAPREVGHKHLALVSNGIRGDVLVGFRSFENGVDVETGLVSESLVTNVGEFEALRSVAYLADVSRQLGQPLGLAAGRQSYPSLSWRLGMIEQRLALPTRSPYPLIVPWT